MPDEFSCQLSFVILLRRLPPRRCLEPMLHRMIIARDNLPANSFGQMNHERRFEIECKRAACLADYDQYLRIVWILESERRNLALGYAHLIVGHKPPRAHHGKRYFRTFQTLQPGERRVLRIAQEHPAMTVLHPDKSVDKCQDISFFNRQAAEFRGRDVHNRLPNVAGTLREPSLEGSMALSYVLAM
jgi:hypothetical protein